MKFLRKLWAGFTVFSHGVQKVMTFLIFSVLYFVVLPFFAVMRFADPLRLRLGAESYWEPYRNPPADPDRFRRPF